MTCYDEPMPHLAATVGFMPVLALAPQDGPCNCGAARTMPPMRTLTDKIKAHAKKLPRWRRRAYLQTNLALAKETYSGSE